MTAINIFRKSDRVVVVTDGLVHNESRDLTSKVVALPHLNAVIMSNGAMGVASMVALGASQAYGFDDLKLNFADLVRQCVDSYPDMMSPKSNSDFEVYVAGWSETLGPDFFWMPGHNRRVNAKAFRRVDRDKQDLLFQPTTQSILLDIIKSWQGRTVDQLDMDVEGPRVIEIQRKHLNASFPDQIGGHALVTTITKHSIESHIAKRWPEHSSDERFQ